MHITLRPGEKLYLNGAVLRADRKVSLELMNDAAFLLESHVMHVEKATSPVRQLYFIVQMMLMNPHDTAAAQGLFTLSLPQMLATYEDRVVKAGLLQAQKHVASARYFDALKVLRGLFELDHELISGAPLAIAS